MKKFLIALTALLSSLGASAQIVPSLHNLNIFNHLAVGAHAATTGFGFEVGTTITNWVELRAGVSIMPGFGFHTDTEVEYAYNAYPGYDFDNNIPDYNNEVTLDANFKRVQGSVIFNIYPFGKKGGFFVAAGGYFGGKDIIKIKGHADPETIDLMKDPYVQIGDYQIDFDENGNVNGALRVNKFRPYIGIGTGHFIPKRRINFSWEIGVQFHGKPKLYANGEIVNLSEVTDDDTYQKIMDKLTVWPVLKFTLSGRIF